MGISVFPAASSGPVYINPTSLSGSAQTSTVTTSFASGYYLAYPSMQTSTILTIGTFSKTFTSGDRLSSFLLVLSSSASSAVIAAASTGISWVTNSGGVSNGQCIVYGDKFVIGRSSGYVSYSTDGVTWSATAASQIGPNYDILDVAYNATPTNKYVAVGEQGGLATSTDGITWATRTSGFGTSKINAVGSGTTTAKYVTCGTYANGLAPIAYSSTDGVTWTNRTVTSTTCNGLSVVFGTVWVMTGQSGNLFTSTDAITWTSRTSGSTVGLAVTYANNLYFTVDANGVLRSSTDAITWTQRATNQGGYSLGDSSRFYDIVYFNNKYYHTNSNQLLGISTDGITWAAPAGVTLSGLATNGTRIVTASDARSSTTGNLVTFSDNAVALTYLGTATLGV
jgi:hypothetical protein